jgi:hypothetical protein
MVRPVLNVDQESDELRSDPLLNHKGLSERPQEFSDKQSALKRD